MSARQRTTERDRRRRSLGQNFLVDRDLIREFIDDLDVRADDLVVDIGAGAGALTIEVARRGAHVWAVEPDSVWVDRLRAEARRHGVADRVTTIAAVVPSRLGSDPNRDVGRRVVPLRLPRSPYRVIANPPFGITTALLAFLLDDPARGPVRADLVVQREVARKHSATPPVALRTAAWAPWWTFRLGQTIGRDAFRPRPGVDAAVLHVERRDPAVLPPALASSFADVLRPAWARTHESPHMRGSDR